MNFFASAMVCFASLMSTSALPNGSNSVFSNQPDLSILDLRTTTSRKLAEPLKVFQNLIDGDLISLGDVCSANDVSKRICVNNHVAVCGPKSRTWEEYIDCVPAGLSCEAAIEQDFLVDAWKLDVRCSMHHKYVLPLSPKK
ncbi:hypothetical protein EDC01DRAFT_626796 [Geopyxis carbonaria]|nr:hypothetical protein EDC01DRAFT_626796 [Geopyxis carbonaria]